MKPNIQWTDTQNHQNVYWLKLEEIIVGRGVEADVTIDHGGVSRFHAKFLQTEEGYTLIDLGSRNGTYLRGDRVEKPIPLRDGDEIFFGKDSIPVLYSLQAPAFEPTTEVRDTTGLERSLVAMGKKFAEEQSEIEKFSCLLDLQFQWSRSFTPEFAFRQIVASALKISAAERGFILLKEPQDFSFAIGINGLGVELPRSEFQTSHSVVDQVAAEGKPVFMTESISGKFAQQASIISMNLRSIACLPLFGMGAAGKEGELLGILYLDSTKKMHHLSGLDEKILNKLAVEAGNVVDKVEMIRSFEQRRKLEAELKLAEETQRSLLPQSLPQIASYRVQAFSKPTRNVGGDFYNLLSANGQDMVGVLGDVTGKGLPAALLSSMLVGCLELQLRGGATLPEALSRINLYLCEKSASNRFASLFLFALDAHGAGQFLSAGHPPAWLFRAASRTIEDLESNGLLLGAFPTAVYQTTPLQMERGDILMIYSDGLTEAENPAGEMLGEELAKEVIQAAASAGSGQLERAILTAIHEFTGDYPQTDDITIMIVERSA